MFHIEDKIFYDMVSRLFYIFIDQGIRWKNCREPVFLLRELASGEIYVVPDDVFYMNFVWMKRDREKMQLHQYGWSDFGIAKLRKDCLRAIDQSEYLYSFK